MAHQKSDGMNYAPQGNQRGLQPRASSVRRRRAGSRPHLRPVQRAYRSGRRESALVFDPDPAKVEQFCRTYPGVKAAARSGQKCLEEPSIRLVAAAAVPCAAGRWAWRSWTHGKDYFADKPPCTTSINWTPPSGSRSRDGPHLAVYYAERLHVECAVYAGQLIEQGAVGRVVQVIGLGPHRLNAAARPAWFWDPAKYGGILVDVRQPSI